MLQNTTLRPGLLVSLKTTISGNVKTTSTEIEADHLTPEGTRRSRWETDRLVLAPAEHEEAVKIRGKCRSLITATCTPSTFMVCPQANASVLEAAIAEARALADEFNRRARITTVKLYIVTGRIAADDAEAVNAINSEIRDLMDSMSKGLRDLDVDTVREAANKARRFETMLPTDAAERIQGAIKAARDAARTIVKAGEQGAADIDLAAIARITEARTMFLDVETPTQDVAAPEEQARAIDLMPEPAAPNGWTSVDTSTEDAAPRAQQIPMFEL